MHLLQRNPLDKVQVKEKAVDKRRSYLPLDRLHNALRSIPTATARQQKYSVWFALLRWSGARRSEPLLLKWKMVDWAKLLCGVLYPLCTLSTGSSMSDRAKMNQH